MAMLVFITLFSSLMASSVTYAELAHAESATILLHAASDTGTTALDERTIIDCTIYSDGRVERHFNRGMKPSTEWAQTEDLNFTIGSKRNHIQDLIQAMPTDATQPAANPCNNPASLQITASPQSPNAANLVVENNCGTTHANPTKEAKTLVELASKICSL